MNPALRQLILDATGADELRADATLQHLWSGYGSIDRYRLSGANVDSVIVKHVRLPERGRHPRGWNTDLSHQRKLRSYQVETAWYEEWAAHCDTQCRVPHCLALEHRDDEVFMVLEDLDDAGYPLRHDTVTNTQMRRCLSWLAHFHATFMGKRPKGLWTIS